MTTRLVALVLSVSVLLGGLSGSAAAQPLLQPQPLAISPEAGPPGTVVQYSGSGFTPGGRVSVLLISGLGLIVDEPTAGAGGAIMGSFRMPEPPGVAELSYGPVDVFAIDEATGRETPPVVFLLTEAGAQDMVTAQIRPVGASGATGTATLAAGDGATGFQLDVSGLSPNGAHAVYVMGRECPGGELQVGVVELHADATGSATATNRVNGSLASFADGEHSIAVFSEGIPGGRPQTGTIIACGAIPQAGQPFLASTWYFAEGSSQPPFDTWFLVQNATSEPARVRFTFQMQTGGTGSQSVTRDFTVGPTSRLSVFANEIVPNSAFSTRITSDRSVFAERSMFVGFEGHVVAGIPSPETRWLFAEGSSQQPFHTWLLLQNPNSEPATATVRYLVQGGPPRTQTLSLPADSRTSIFVNQVVPDAAFSMRVESDTPIIAERAMYRFPGNAAMGVAGVAGASRTWYFAEGSESARGLPTDTWLLLQNPNESQVPVTVTIVREDGDPVDLSLSLAPSSRQSVYLNQLGDFGSFGIRVEAGAEVVAERSMFFGGEPRGSHATAGSPVLASRWHLAEGSTAAPFDEVIAIVNPNDQAATADVEFQLADGRTVARGFVVPAQRKLSIRVDDIVPDAAVSAEVITTLPTVVERTMFFEKSGGLGVHNTIGIR